MRTIQLLLLFFATVAVAFADDITLTDGRIFKAARVLSETPSHVSVRHEGGISQISKKLLPADLAAKYPLNESAALELVKKDAAFKEARSKAVKENLAKRLEDIEAKRTESVAQEEEERAMTESKLSMEEIAQKVVSAKFEAHTPGKNNPIGLYGVRVFFCTPEQWDAYQEKRKALYEDEYKAHCALIHAQGYDRSGDSAANNGEWLNFRRWLRRTYEEVPEHFANAKTSSFGTIVVPVMQRPFVMFARSERSEGEGWDRYVWVRNSSGFEPGVQKVFTLSSSVREEPWAKLPRYSPLTTNVEGD